MLIPVKNKEFSTEAVSSIKTISSMTDKIRKAYLSSKEIPDIYALFSSDEILVFKTALITLFAEVDLGYVLIETGIPMGTSFFDQTSRIIKSKILPYVYDECDLRLVARKIFHHSKDGEMLEALTQAHGTSWLGNDSSLLVPDISILQNQLESATKVLSYRLAATGMEEEMAIRAGEDGELITPFMEQNREINELLVSLSKEDKTKADEDFAQCVVMLKQCKENIHSLDKAAATNGASLQQTFILNKSSRIIDRLIIILTLLQEMEEEVKVSGFLSLIRDIVILEISPKKLRDFFSSNIQLIAYRITENKRKTGEHYITAGRGEYWDMFMSAAGGGFIVSFMVIIKLMLHHAKMPPLWEGILFSLNYAGGFVLVHILGFTIATKQPAMTAAYIAASLDGAKTDKDGYENFAAMIAAVSRSQLSSFAGNLLVVFPFSLLWIFIMQLLIGDHFLDQKAAQDQLNSVHPIFTLSILYAALAGFDLFLAGLISGFGDNKVIVSHIGIRILHHPWLNKKFSQKTISKIATYTEQNLGPILGNIAVGFLLGMTAFFGHITGLPLDIRHVTFSMGNLALGLFGTQFHVTVMEVFAMSSGLFLIGVVNFLVSFMFALQVAIRSRGLRLNNYPELAKAVLTYFWKHPGLFFYPSKTTSKQVIAIDVAGHPEPEMKL
jgi:site-specific recombinase